MAPAQAPALRLAGEALLGEGVEVGGRQARLAQALSALYPPHTEEKRWVDGVLARKKGLSLQGTCMETSAMEWRERISIDPAVCHGRACIKGTRIPVAVVLDNLAAGLSAEEIVASYPPLCVDDVRAATADAAELARERIVEIGQRGAA